MTPTMRVGLAWLTMAWPGRECCLHSYKKRAHNLLSQQATTASTSAAGPVPSPLYDYNYDSDSVETEANQTDPKSIRIVE